MNRPIDSGCAAPTPVVQEGAEGGPFGAPPPTAATNRSVAFFDRQFRQQIRERDYKLNPFELDVLPLLTGRVLDFGCGLGNLALAAAACGCSVQALDASPAAIDHLRQRAAAASLPVEAIEADLRNYTIRGDFDCVVSIGLLMFFDCQTSLRIMSMLQERVRPGGIAVINTLAEGTTYFDMFHPDSYCLLPRDTLGHCFAAWDVLHSDVRDFEAPGQTIKSFVTIVARKPESGAATARRPIT